MTERPRSIVLLWLVAAWGCSSKGVEARLGAADPVVRREALESLHVDDATERVVEDILVADPVLSVRVSAANALGRSGLPRALEKLGEAASTHADVTTKVAAIEALAGSHRREAVPLLISLWAVPEDQAGGVVSIAVDRAIASFLQDAAEPLLDAALRSRSAPIRYSAARALHRLSRPPTEKAIADALRGAEPEVVRNAEALQAVLAAEDR